MNKISITPKTITLISKIIKPISDEGLIPVSEFNEIILQLKHLAEKGTTMPVIIPKLIDQAEAADMLGIGLSNFKKLEKDGAFTFTRRMVGSAVRYRNTDIINFICVTDIKEDQGG